MNGMRMNISSPTRSRHIRRLVGVTLALGALTVGVSACGSDAVDQGVKTPVESTIGQLGVTGQWARATIADAKNTAAYFTVVSATNDRLTGVAVDASVAARAEIHQSMMMGSDSTMDMGSDSTAAGMGGGEMQMGPVDGVDIAANTPFVFEPGGYHIMLFDVAKPLADGDTITLTLTFQEHGDVTLEVPVRSEAP
jgi:copper(I)-binding protein